MDLIDREQAYRIVRANADEWLADIKEGSYKAGFGMGTHLALQTILYGIPSAEHALAKCVDTLNAIAQIISIAPSTIQEDVFRYKMICDVMRKYEGEKNG